MNEQKRRMYIFYFQHRASSGSPREKEKKNFIGILLYEKKSHPINAPLPKKKKKSKKSKKKKQKENKRVEKKAGSRDPHNIPYPELCSSNKTIRVHLFYTKSPKGSSSNPSPPFPLSLTVVVVGVSNAPQSGADAHSIL